MSSSPPGPYSGIWESQSYRAAFEDLRAALDFEDRRLDDVCEAASWALGENPLQFEPIDDTDSYFIPIRGFGHPDLVVIFTYDIATNASTLQWIGTA